MPFNQISTARELVLFLPEFYNQELPIFDKWKEVRVQAAGHMLRQSVTHLYDIVRPNEPEEVRDYRENVHRDITSEGPWKFISKVTRIFLDNGIRPDPDKMSEALKDYLNAGPFYTSGVNDFDIEEFIYQVLLPFMIEDPNGYLVPLPFNEFSPNIAPARPEEEGGISPLDRIAIKSILITSQSVVYLGDKVLAWKAGEMAYDSKGSKAPFYFMVDDREFIIYYPTRDGEGGKVTYIAEVWFFHGLGYVPAAQMGGIMTRFKEEATKSPDEINFYHESFLWPYFNYADEFLSSFSDNQAVRIQHAYPKAVMKPIPCTNPDCKDGTVRIREPESGKIIRNASCGTCQGSGYLTNPGPYKVLIKEDLPGVADTGPVLEYISPPPDILQHSWDVSFNLLTMAKKSIGLDLLENVTESGVAKSMRLDDLRDFLWNVANSLTKITRSHLRSIEYLLNIEVEDQVEPSVYLPQVIHFTNRSLLKEEATSAIFADRVKSNLLYLRQKYRDDEVSFKIYSIAYNYAPLLALDTGETSQALAIGSYSPDDILKRDHIIMILQAIADEIGEEEFLTSSKEDIIEVADALFFAMFPVEEEEDPFDVPLPEEEEEEASPVEEEETEFENAG